MIHFAFTVIGYTVIVLDEWVNSCSLLYLNKNNFYLVFEKWFKKKGIWNIAVVILSLILVMTKVIDYKINLELELAEYICIMLGLILVFEFSIDEIRLQRKTPKKVFSGI